MNRRVVVFAARREGPEGALRPGLRLIGFGRRITVASSVGPRSVVIQRVFYAGQNWTDAL
jgi:toxin ParE1/3/4